MIDERKLQERGLPQSIEAEKNILGSLLFDNEIYYRDGVDKLDESDFALSSNTVIFSAIRSFIVNKKPVDLLILRDHLVAKNKVESVGGFDYLLSLDENIHRNRAVHSYVSIIREKARLRQAATVAQRVYDDAIEQGANSLDVIERSIEDLRSLANESDDTELQSVGDFFTEQGEPEHMFEAMATINGIHLGFNQLHEVTGGPQPGELWIVAARPSMGKTAWMCNVARHAAVQVGRAAAVFSLEQKKKDIVRRMLSASARIDYKEIKQDDLRAQDRALLLEHRSILSRAPLYIDDRPGLTVSRIKARSLRMKSRVGLEIVLIDQLSHVSMADCRERDFRLKVGEQTKALKRMAQELDVPVIVFNQLSREAGKRKDFVPTLADLKESGNIEEDADVVCLLHRPEYYDKSDAALEGLGQMIIAKNREGETKTLNCMYQGRILRWEDTAETPAHQDSFYDRTTW